MRPKSETLTGQELEIMKVIWPRGQATIREVCDDLRLHRTIAYTTVQTMMNILETKGHLRRTQGEKAHIYEPVRPQQTVVKSMVSEFVNRVFDGSARPLLVHLLKEKGLTEREPRTAEVVGEGGQMTIALWAMIAYALQLGALVLVALIAIVALGIRLPRHSLMLWQAVMLMALLLPLAQPQDANPAGLQQLLSSSMATTADAIERSPSRLSVDLATLVLSIVAAGIVLRLYGWRLD